MIKSLLLLFRRPSAISPGSQTLHGVKNFCQCVRHNFLYKRFRELVVTQDVLGYGNRLDKVIPVGGSVEDSMHESSHQSRFVEIWGGRIIVHRNPRVRRLSVPIALHAVSSTPNF